MIGRLTGRLVRRTPSGVLLDVGGVGYIVAIPLSTYGALTADGETASLEIHTVVREDAILLFGFATEMEKSVFEMLISVSGVGPKMALAALSSLSTDELLRAISSGNGARLRSIPGIGRKIAERIALELQEKAGKLGAVGGTGIAGSPRAPDADEAESALVNLGYGASEARRALEAVQAGKGPLPIEALLREALKQLAR
jgi:Holliday junction DNA helicase RuvA